MLLGRSQRNGIGNNQLGNIGLSNAAQSRIGQDGVSTASINLVCTKFLQRTRTLGEGACSINHIINQNAVLALNITNQVHNLGNTGLRTALINNSHRRIQNLGKATSTAYTAQIRGNNNHVLQILLLNIFSQQRAAGHMVKGDIEEALNLCCVQVDGNHAGNTCSFQKVSHQLSSNGLTAARLAVLTSIAIIRNYSGNMVSAGTFEGISHNQQLHHVIVNNGATGRLYDKDILATYTLVNHYLDFAVVETVHNRIAYGSTQISSNLSCQIGVSITGKNS